MFANTNQEMVKELAQETMKSHKLRNVMAAIAIALTAILITVLCGLGIGVVQAILTEANMNPGPGTNGSGIVGGLDVLEKVRQQPDVEFADIARLCMQGTPHNKEFAGNEVKFLGVNKEFYGHHYVELLCGEYPANAGEILFSDTMAEKIGMEQIPGQKITLNLMILKDGEAVETPMEMKVSGFYNNPLRAITDYEEIYTTEDFPDLYNPELGDDNTKIYTKLEGLTGKSPNAEKSSRLEALNATVGGEGTVLIYSSDYTSIYLGCAALLILIMACGYFLIYNIFYISVVNDIRFMGSMKTIGMTGKQIRTMLGYQVRRLGLIGTLSGIAAGTLVNISAESMMKQMDMTFARYYKTHPAAELAIFAAIVFTAVTVYLSSRKAFALAAKISPVEAARFRASGRKKTAFAVISFALSGVLFCTLFTALTGYDIEWQTDRMNLADFKVIQQHAGTCMESSYEPLEEGFALKVAAQPFVEEAYISYRARNPQQEKKEERMDESRGEIRFTGKFAEVMKKDLASLSVNPTEEMNEYGDLYTGILGIPAKALAEEEQKLDVLDGELDAEKFATGDYIIYNVLESGGAESYRENPYLKAGEELELSIYSYEKEDYVTKSFQVLAVTDGKNDVYGQDISFGTSVVLPDTTFREIYGDGAKKMISAISLRVAPENEKECQETLERMIAENFNPQVHVESKYATRIYEQKQKEQKQLLGIAIGLIFGFIGLMNILNTLVTGVMARKTEFAAMQSIGMTKKQMAGTIFKDGMKMILISTAMLVPLGIPVAQAAATYPLSTGFVPWLYAASAGMVVAAGTLLAAGVAVVLTNMLNQKTVVERLREAE